VNAAPDRRRLLAVLAACIAIVAVLVIVLRSPDPVDAPAGQPAVTVPAPAQARVRAALTRDDEAIDGVPGYAPFVAIGGAKHKQIALTFDDGPGPTTPALLDHLQAHAVPATFFLIGHAIAQHTDLVLRELDAGFSVGTHTDSHDALASRPSADQQDQILAAADRITRISRHAVRLFRPPYGSYDANTLRIVRAERMLMVLWSIDPGDYSAKRPRQIVDATLAAARPGAIVLLHDGPGARPKTLAAVRMLVPALRRRGYKLVSVPELLRDDPPPRRQPAPRGAGR